MKVNYHNSPEAYYHEEGRINLLSGMNLRHEYSLRDHLGNTRICFTDSDNDGDPEILQQTNYYPFGLPIQELSTTFDGVGNNYQYNGKELNEDFGLHWMDYGARWYDPQINRWGQVDPLAEKFYAWNGYNYVMGNPVIFVDPDGRNTAYYDQDGKLIHYSYDDLPDAVTSVSSGNIDRFHSLTGGQRDASYSKEGAGDMRNMGISYMVEGIKSFALRSDARRDQTGNFFEADSNGKIGQPAKVESKNNLYTIDGKNVYVGSSYNDNIGSPGASEPPKNSEVLFGIVVSDIHHHGYNDKEQRFYYKHLDRYMVGPVEFGPSIKDIEKSLPRNYYRIVTGRNEEGGLEIYFYGNSEAKSFSVPLNKFNR